MCACKHTYMRARTHGRVLAHARMRESVHFGLPVNLPSTCALCVTCTSLVQVQMLNARMTAAIPDFSPRFIIDTGRNGVSGAIRQSCANWCNIRGAGLGRKPTSRTDLPDIVDAYFWLKTPGESDGCTEHLPDGSRCPRFDAMCASVDSIGSAAGEPRAPEAGDWFIPQLAELSCHGAIEGKDSGFTSECQSKLRVAAQEEGLTLSTTSSIAVDTPRSKDATMTVGERQQRTAVIPLNDPRWQQDSAYGPAIRPDSGTGYSPGGAGSWQPRQSTVESTGGSSHVVLGLSLLGLALFGFLRHGGHYWKPHAREVRCQLLPVARQGTAHSRLRRGRAPKPTTY